MIQPDQTTPVTEAIEAWVDHLSKSMKALAPLAEQAISDATRSLDDIDIEDGRCERGDADLDVGEFPGSEEPLDGLLDGRAVDHFAHPNLGQPLDAFRGVTRVPADNDAVHGDGERLLLSQQRSDPRRR